MNLRKFLERRFGYGGKWWVFRDELFNLFVKYRIFSIFWKNGDPHLKLINRVSTLSISAH